MKKIIGIGFIIIGVILIMRARSHARNKNKEESMAGLKTTMYMVGGAAIVLGIVFFSQMTIPFFSATSPLRGSVYREGRCGCNSLAI